MVKICDNCQATTDLDKSLSKLFDNKNVVLLPRYMKDNQMAVWAVWEIRGSVTVVGYMEKIQEVPTADSGTDIQPLEQVQNDAEYNVFANVSQHSEQPKSTSNTCLVEKNDSNVTPNSLDMCDNDIQTDHNAEECDDERVALANLIANLKLDADENKKH
ncbi:hypothetical protein Tco_0823301 [Tanacetum coccineum]|uniref:Uncharacterized protein n=1 Tax=Tanacetum coccineum TaxID=301880 RepID=A0ABQ5AK47_9ASTR